MRYRPEIDGLRAIAVLPVVLFHADIPAFSGGYIGVDVFFVISGYLMSILILEGMRDGSFSLLGFYERRARRILPALFTVMICCIPFAWLWMQPSQLEEFAKSLITVSLFASNFQFWQESGYFTADAELKPLLHTWSLAVEEQYYLVIPLVTLAFWRFGQTRFLALLVTVAAGSFLLCEWGWRNAPDFNFYFTATRVWELLIGAICGVILTNRTIAPNQAFAAAGLALVVIPVFWFDSSTPFPSLYALLPVIGTGCVILFAGERTMAAQVLSHRWLVGIGLISYSIYLWHQPLFAFTRLRLFDEPSTGLMLLLSLASVMLAYASWRWVEQPFRRHDARFFSSRRMALGASVMTIGLLSAVGAMGVLNDGVPERAMVSGRTYAEMGLSEKLALNFGLHSDCEFAFTLSTHCRTHENPELVLWGDSYAMHLAPALLASRPDIRMVQHTMSACSPVVGGALINKSYPMASSRRCIQFNDQVFDWIKGNPGIETVVLSSAFAILSAEIYHRDGRVTHTLQHEWVRQALSRTIDTLKQLGKEVVLVSPAPANGIDLGACLAKAAMLGLSQTHCDFKRSDIIPFVRTRFEFATDMASQIPVVMLADLICDGGPCRTRIGDIFIYRDNAHLSAEGSAYLGATHDFYRLVKDAKVGEQ
ncbi:acyltransferase family protein [Pseudohoeflea coraliihabitans]|uniref:Acyltransferase n=1 Tax=Pseudohoeflea coraliihabitans TaxID=2860393 RepID=A0ABS6WM56_9HYPH|nr:acyltransferase family protein [Pseudohoeflea sp. DP4N28-3]MBW3097022.1 acyltransferase [Pseudohoeflea sp. DP4N28-3]